MSLGLLSDGTEGFVGFPIGVICGHLRLCCEVDRTDIRTHCRCVKAKNVNELHLLGESDL